MRLSRLIVSVTAEYVSDDSVTVGFSGFSAMPRPARRAIGGRRQLARALLHRLLELARRIDGVDQLPLDRALALHAFDERAEEVGEIAAHVTLVDDAREAAGAGQHAEQRRLRQADRRVAIVDQQDVVARERELVAAAGADAVERREELQARSARSRPPSPGASRW